MIRGLTVFLFLCDSIVFAGGGPESTLIVVNDNSRDSQELGKYYSQKRNIAQKNICHIRVTTNYNITDIAFSNEIRAPVINSINSSGLSNQIDYVVFSCDIPYRVYTSELSSNLYSALNPTFYYNFTYSPDAFKAGCQLAVNSVNDYFKAERGFAHSEAPSSNRYYINTILTSTNLSVSKQLIDRSVQVDYSSPTGNVYFYHTLDPRNVQWPEFEPAAFNMRFLDVPTDVQFRDGYLHENPPMTNVMGCMVGQMGFTLSEDTFKSGAIAEHLTSYGGVLFEPCGQSSILKWISAGCAGSYGAVVEPCAYWEKFPDARMHYWYARGFSLGESFWMSVRNPYQGVFVGDPLCRPFAVPSEVAINGISNEVVYSGAIPLSIAAISSGADRPLCRIDIFMDHVLLATVTNIQPEASNTITIVINGTNSVYEIKQDDGLYDIASSVAVQLNAEFGSTLTASASGDRVEVAQDAVGVPGAWMTIDAYSSTGTATRLTTHAYAPYTNFIESIYPAYEGITLSGNPVSGDVVRITITNISGIVITNDVVASTNDTANTLLGQLTSNVNADSFLQGSDGCEMKWVYNGAAYLVARTNTWEGANLHVNYQLIKQPGSTLVGPPFSDYFNDNEDVTTAHATVFISCGSTGVLAGNYSLQTTNYADGPHELTAICYEGTAVRTISSTSVLFYITNNTVSCMITNPLDDELVVIGGGVDVDVDAKVIPGSITGVTLYVEGKIYSTSAGGGPYQFNIMPTNYGFGRLELQSQAWDANGLSCLSEKVVITIVDSNIIEATSGPNGSIAPSGVVVIARGDDAAFAIIPDQYYNTTNIRVDSLAVEITNQYTFMTVTNDHTIFAEFGASSVTQGVPQWWLVSYGLATSDAAALADQDGDFLYTWEEYIADTNPTNAASYYGVITNLTGTTIVQLETLMTSTARVYDLYSYTNLLGSDEWLPQGLDVWGSGSNLWLVVTNDGPLKFYRAGVRLP